MNKEPEKERSLDLAKSDASGLQPLRPWIALIAIILLVWAMRGTSVVTMPLGIAVFIVILAWPLYAALEHKFKFPQWLCLIITLLVILFVITAFVGTLAVCVETLTSKMPFYQQRVSQLMDGFTMWAQDKGFSEDLIVMEPQELVSRVMSVLGGFVTGLYEFFGLLLMVVAFAILAFLEVRPFRHKLETRVVTMNGPDLLHAASEAARNIQLFMLTRTLTSSLTGVCSGIYTWAVGLDFALVWGITAFLLNYIPVIGSVLAVIPPTLVALLLPEALWLAPVTLGGLTIIQFTIGNYLDPQLQGRFLSLSPIMLFFSIPFWGWVWGIPGALLGVPLTVGIVVTCRHFPSTRWVAELFSHKSE